MTETDSRRPISQRDRVWAKWLTRALAKTPITPNQISVASILFAGLAGWALWRSCASDGMARIAFLITGALGCQLRLLCNMIDGMVAVEAKKGSPDGPFWNEAPDRLSDILILVGAGYGVAQLYRYGDDIGWVAAMFAVLTAYVREVGHANGAPQDFSGPMAKPHRMALITACALISIFEVQWGWRGKTLLYGLILIALGSALTAALRSIRLVRALKANAGRPQT